ncbi:hypothetical protein RHMOL_Rhmol12G0122000 [Rhododendron molle]|uniref:Uncharacterized protein n=1 Tax=Rhododendron molle TaxID=49168 RepID=A0ACC0LI47_RHOML|nr:hypothetical protein RHMOL_Rhmol12G0122000 [Rhododendron molle]
MVLCNGVRNTVSRTSEPSDRASDGSDLISAMNDSLSLVVEMRSKPWDARSDGLEVHITVLCTSLHAVLAYLLCLGKIKS